MPESSIASIDVEDRWRCDGPIVAGEERISLGSPIRSSSNVKPQLETVDWHLWTLRAFLEYLSGSADPGGFTMKMPSGRIVLLISLAYKGRSRNTAEDDDPNSSDYISWETWTPPALNFAYFRRTGQRCFVHDWKDLEKDCITWKEADRAKRYTDEYIAEAVRNGHYTDRDLAPIEFATEFGAIEGYGRVEHYEANGMEIPCTATTAAGRSHARGNHFNSTRSPSLPFL
jgi:hypothetical protein